MSDFEVLVLGVGDSFSEHHHPTSLLLRAQGFNLAIDCPDMYRAVLGAAVRRAGAVAPGDGAVGELTVNDVDHVLLTHVHGDHMNGLEGLAFYKHFVERKKLVLATSPDVRQVLWSERLAVSMGQLWNGAELVRKEFEDYFEYVPLDWDAPTTLGPFRIRTRRTRHHVPTSALLIEVEGKLLGYSCDTAYDPDLIDFLSEAELIIHETNYGPAHTPYAALATLPEELRRRMRLIHYPDGFDVTQSAIRCLEEGELLGIGAGSSTVQPSCHA